MSDVYQAALYEKARREKARRVAERSADRNADGTYGQPPEGYFLNPNTGQMTSREGLKQQVDSNMAESLGAGFIQGYGVDAVDEAAGAVGMAEGGPEMANLRREQARAGFEGAEEQHPILFNAGKIAGAVVNPITRAMPATNTIRGGAAAAAVEGAASGYAAGERDAMSRFWNAAKEGTISSAFGGGSSALFKGGNRAIQKFARRNEIRPTIDGLRDLKNSAYAAVRKSGVDFDENETLAAFQRLNRKAKTSRWDLDEVSEVDKPAFDALRVLERRANLGRPITLNNLDKTRQKLWDIYTKSENPFVLEAIGEIDEMIARKADGNKVMAVAREANSRYAKAQLLENAFRKARLQTSSTGSGGNILNKYRQAVTRIITNPREAKWFSPEELQVMESFVTGDTAENVFRRVGKLAPGGNGLMTALNVYAASVDPALLAVTGVATAAKSAADRSAMKGSDAVLDAVSTGVIRRPQSSPSVRGLAVGSGELGTNLLE